MGDKSPESVCLFSADFSVSWFVCSVRWAHFNVKLHFFNSYLGQRRGTDIDAQKLKDMFIWYGFAVERLDNLTAEV